MSTYAMTCSVCRRRFVGTPVELRDTIWPHADTHSGRIVRFRGDPVVLSCNCGTCAFCRAQVPYKHGDKCGNGDRYWLEA